MDPRAWGVDTGYHDYRGDWKEPPPQTIDAILDALTGGSGPAPGPASGPPDGPAPGPVRFARAGWAGDAGDARAVELEDGGSAAITDGRLPVDLPPGYHSLIGPDAAPTPLIVTPGVCHLPPDLRTWGLAVQLYAARSHASWGIGDLADLRTVAEWSADRGAGMTLVNPLHASLPLPDGQQSSPYYPSSRCFRNPIFLRVEEVPGWRETDDATGGALAKIARAARDANRDRRIDRNVAYRHKRDALSQVWERFRDAGGDPGFDRYREEQGDLLASYATFCTLVEAREEAWPAWPDELSHPDRPAVRAFAAAHADRVAFHAWLQWLTESQLQAAGRRVGMVQDLAIGTDPAGADTWLWQDCFALGMSVGAPPDEYNRAGQDWGLPPFDPWRLRAAGYEPFIRTVRAGLRHAGGLRFDHVMGLFRLFWIPRTAEDATAGTYVRYPADDLLDILALESHRAGAWVVGEDLGTVEDEVRERLRDRKVLSYRLLWFEPEPPPAWPRQALGAVTTHDLPTVAGLWTGADLDRQRAHGVDANEDSTAELKQRLEGWLGVEGDAPVDAVVTGAHRLLGEAPCAVVTATLDDAAAVLERPNLPGTTVAENWSLALPRPLEDLLASDLAAAIARDLDAR